MYKNNPLNIQRLSGRPWFGEDVTFCDDFFCEFTSVNYCVCAWLILLLEYRSKGVYNISSIIRRFCPGDKSSLFISYVCGQCSIDDGFVVHLDHPLKLFEICKAFCFMETRYILEPSVFDSAYHLFLFSKQYVKYLKDNTNFD